MRLTAFPFIGSSPKDDTQIERPMRCGHTGVLSTIYYGMTMCPCTSKFYVGWSVGGPTLYVSDPHELVYFFNEIRYYISSMIR